MSIKKCVNGSFVNDYYREYGTETDTITTLPKSIIADGQSASADIIGNMVQTGTPTPQNPIQPSETGDLETTGAHAGQYKIPILCGGTTTPVYLGEVQSERKIKKLVLTGEETIYYNSTNKVFYFVLPTAYYTGSVRTTPLYCSHYLHIDDGRPFAEMPNNSIYIASYGSEKAAYVYTTDYTDTTTYKAYLAAQYAAGTPVTVWYVLATPTTGIVNEPIRKIGNYADSVSVTGIPTTGTAESFDIDTELKPSEVQLTYRNTVSHFKTERGTSLETL